MFALFALGLLVLATYAATVSKTNTTDGSVDNGTITRTVTFTTTDFVTGSSIADVNVSVDFEKLSGTCSTGHDGDNPYNQEIYFLLSSPSGTQIVLVEDASDSGGSGQGPTYESATEHGGRVTVTFDDEAATAVGGTAPISGTFRPVQPLSAFDGEDPLGTWTLTVGDSAPSDPLCFYDVAVTITADQPPAVDDQTFSVDEDSPNGTSVGTVQADDPDLPDDKLTYEIIAGDPTDVFAIDPLTGEITVNDSSQLDHENNPTYTLTVEVTDSTGLTDTATITINVTDVNEAPTAVDDDGYATDEDTVLNVAPDGVLANDSDVDGDTLSVGDADTTSASGATVTVDTDGGFTYDPTGSSTLQALTASDSVIDTFVYTATDPGGLTDTAVVNVTVTGVDDAPIARDDTATTPEETPVTITVLDDDEDAEDGTPSVDSVDTPTNGTATTNGTTVTYTPTVDFVGTDVFTYTVIDSTGLTDTATLTVNVTNVNDPPTAVDDDGYATDEDTMLTVAPDGVLANDSDVDGDTLSVGDADTTSVNGATVTVDTDGGFTYDPTGSSTLQALTASDSVIDTFVYTATDPGGLTDTAVVSVTVSGVDDAPVAHDDTATTPEETPVSITVLDNDEDPEGNSLSVTALGTPSDGTATHDGTTVSYTPTVDFVGTDVFTYTIEDSTGLTDTALITVTVTNVNDEPTDISLTDNTVAENEQVGTVVGTFSTTDPDSGDTHTYSLVPGLGDDDNDSFDIVGNELQTLEVFDHEMKPTYDIRVQTDDGNGGTYEERFVISVTDVNDPPTAVDDPVSDAGGTTDEDTVLTVTGTTVLDNDFDQDGDSVSVVGDDGTSANGAAVSVEVSGTYTYDPTGAAALQALAAGEELTDTFGYTAGDGSLTDTAVVSVTVTGVNDVPVAEDDSVSTPEDTPVTISVLDNDNDVDASDVLTVGSLGTPSDGTADTDGTSVTYTPTLEFNGTDVFTYTIGDGSGGTDSATITVTVNAVNDPPTANDDADATDEDTPIEGATPGLLDNDDDPENDPLSVTAFDAVSANGATVTVSSTGVYTYNPTAASALQALAVGDSIVDTFGYTASDGSLTDTAVVSVTVTGVNDAPVAGDDLANTAEDTSVTVAALDNDDDVDTGDTLTVADVGTPSNGTATTDGTTVIYTPTVDFTGTDVFTYTVADGNGGTDVATITVSVRTANDPPTAVDDSDTTDEDTVLSVTADGVLANDSDPDGDTLTVTDYGPVSAEGATVTVGADGSYEYDPTDAAALQALGVGDTVTDTFEYTIDDGAGLTDTATVSIAVAGVNDVPVAADDTASTPKDSATTIDVLANDDDADGDTLTVTALGTPTGGTATTDGTDVTYTPAGSFVGTDVFTYTVDDGNGGTDTATITVTVTGEFRTFLPYVSHNFMDTPDLVVTDVRGSTDYVEVVIENVGSAATTSSFWVDFYIDPDPAPTNVNQLWQDVADEGIVWGITESLAAGEAMTLTYSTDPEAPNTYYEPEFSRYSGVLPAGTPIYAQVDSAHVETDYGSILEEHEIYGGAYNNVSEQATAEAGQ